MKWNGQFVVARARAAKVSEVSEFVYSFGRQPMPLVSPVKVPEEVLVEFKLHRFLVEGVVGRLGTSGGSCHDGLTEEMEPLARERSESQNEVKFSLSAHLKRTLRRKMNQKHNKTYTQP